MLKKFIENELHKDLVRSGGFLLFFGLFMQYAQESSPKQCVELGIILLILGFLIPFLFKLSNKPKLPILILIAGLSFLLPNKSFATALTVPYCSESTGGYIFASHWNGNCGAITTWANNQNIDGTSNIAVGGVGTTNIANLAVTDAKIAGITTAGKVNGSAITQINNVPSGAGALPSENGGTGSDLSAGVQGGIPYFSSTGVMAALGAGTSGQYPQSQGAGNNILWANQEVASILSYGTSNSVSSAQSSIKMVYGQYTMMSTNTTTISGLPFTSSSSYYCLCSGQPGTGTGDVCGMVNSSGSQTVMSNNGNNITDDWVCFGT